MSEARQRLEQAIARLEAVAARPVTLVATADTTHLEARCAALETASREAVARIDRLLSERRD